MSRRTKLGAAGREIALEPAAAGNHQRAVSRRGKRPGKLDGILIGGAGFERRHRDHDRQGKPGESRRERRLRSPREIRTLID